MKDVLLGHCCRLFHMNSPLISFIIEVRHSHISVARKGVTLSWWHVMHVLHMEFVFGEQLMFCQFLCIC